MRAAFCVVTLVAMTLPLSLSLPTHLHDAAMLPAISWTFKTGGELGASGALSSDSRVFYIGSR
jgi:hypothetical protein